MPPHHSGSGFTSQTGYITMSPVGLVPKVGDVNNKEDEK